MTENFEKFLKKIGVGAEVITKLTEGNAEDDNFNLEDLAADFVKGQKTVLSNDPELIKNIRDEIRGTELSKIEHKIKKTFNLSAEEMKDKKFDDIIEFAFDKTKSASSGTSDELQSQIVDLNNKVKQYEEEILPAAKNEAQTKINKFRQDLALRDVLSKRQLIVNSEVAIPVVESYISQNFNVSLNDKGILEVKTKDNLNPLNSDGTKVLSFDEIVDSHLNALQLIKQSNGNNGNGTPPITIQNGNGNDKKPTFALRGMDAAEANVQNLAKVKEFGK